jgi:arginine N-succinyltransferase
MQTPPLSSAVTPTLPKRSFWRHPLVITLCVLLGLAGVAAAAAGIWWKSNFDPAPFKLVALTTQEQAAFDQKLAAFTGNAALAAAPAPVTDLEKRTLVITEKEVNAWLAKNDLGENVQVRFKNGKITGAIILELPEDLPFLAGQKIKASLALVAHLNDASRDLALQVDDVTVGGMPLPNAWVGDIKGMSLVDESARVDLATEKFLKGIRQFEIREGSVVVKFNK